MGFIIDAKNKLTAYNRSRTVTIAVAGLSRSGKSAFITSVIANLEAAMQTAEGQKWLNGLDVVDSGRLHSARRPPNFTAINGYQFPYKDMLAALAANTPTWPKRTANIYETALDVRFWPNHKPQQASDPTASLRLVFVDYPGEWLVDVPMARQDYADWSKTVFERLLASPWSDISGAFQAFVAATKWDRLSDDETTQQAALAWQRVLLAARDNGLKWLQPGQFVRKRGESEEASAPSLQEQALWFCPLPANVISDAKRGSLAHAMEKRYSSYRKGVKQFFSETLKDASRHLLLIDVLETLAEGENAFNETAAVLGEVYGVLADSHPGAFKALFSKSGFDKVLLVATKADTVPPNQRAALSSLLKDMCSGTIAGNANIPNPVACYTAAIRATEDVEWEVDGAKVRVVKGLCADTGKQVLVKMIDIPDAMPDSAYFKRRVGVRTPRFVPPKIKPDGRSGIPNVQLGKVLDNLIGDLLK
jgi:predicted YcjX-like family ATPase